MYRTPFGSYLLIMFAVIGFFAIGIVAHLQFGVDTSMNLNSQSDLAQVESIELNGQPIIVYFSNENQTQGAVKCGFVYGVERSPSTSHSPYEQALEALFKGPTETEKDQGYSSFFSSKTSGLLKKLTVLDGVAYVDLHDPRQLIPNASTSCGSQAFLASITETLKHDRQISKVVFAIEGDQMAFYDWLQIGCPNKDTNCKDTHF